jgi:hypothetical protein
MRNAKFSWMKIGDAFLAVCGCGLIGSRLGWEVGVGLLFLWISQLNTDEV